jgi:replication factor C subunit 1
MDIRKFLGKPRTRASAESKPTAASSLSRATRATALSAPTTPVQVAADDGGRSATRSRRVVRIVIDDDDDDGDDDGDKEWKGDVVEEAHENVEDDDDDFVLHVPDDAVMKEPARQKPRAVTSRKRTRLDAVELAAIPGVKTASPGGGAGFGDGDNTRGSVVGGRHDDDHHHEEKDPEDVREPDAKKAKATDSYKKFLNRGAPANKGAKELPVGAPNCLEGKVFVITGVLDSLERDDCADLIKQYGGRCVTSVSKKVTHGVVGMEPGESKLKKLVELKVPQIDEDGLFALISSTGNKVPSRQLGRAAKNEPATSETDGADALPSHAINLRGTRDPKVDSASLEGTTGSKPGNGKPAQAPRGLLNADLWVDKYKPRHLDDLVANPKIYEQIGTWLRSWKSRNLFTGMQESSKSRRASASSRGDDDFPAILLAGPPGIGKTTAAHIICRENGFEPIEFNASDVRNKGGVQQLATSLTLGGSMSQYFSSSVIKAEAPVKHTATVSGKKRRDVKASRGRPVISSEYPNGAVLIMDEVDGMSGGDRGGSQELLKMMKMSRIPIICICNDDSSQKMRTLANNCFKLKFRRPMASQVRDRIMLIARKEGFHSIDSQTAERLAEGCHGDIRQMINLLQTWRSASPSLSFTDVKTRLQQEGKSFEQLSIFDVFQTFFTGGSGSNTIAQRMDNFFLDSDLIPLFIAENYLSTRGARNSRGMVEVAEAAEAISEGDLSNAVVRRDQRWDLMPACSVLSSVLPGSLVGGGLAGRPAFPSYLGNISKGNKFKKIVRELEMKVKAVQTSSGSARAFRLDYIPTLTMCLATPLIKDGGAGIPDVIERLDAYYLQKEDWNAVMELGVFKEKRGPLDVIPGAVKSALTREYNKLDHAVSTVTGAKIGAKGKQDGGDLVAKKAAAAGASEDVGILDEDGESDGDDAVADDDNSDVDLEQFKVKAKGRGKNPRSAGKAKAKPRSRKSAT